MSSRTVPSRRRFFASAGAALSAPLAAGAAWGGAPADDLAGSRAGDAIRRLEQALAACIRSGDGAGVALLFVDPEQAASLAGIRHLAPADFGEREVVELAADGASARIELPCEIETETEIEAEGTLAEMARLQGDGLLRRRVTRTLEADLVAIDGAWKFVRLGFR